MLEIILSFALESTTDIIPLISLKCQVYLINEQSKVVKRHVKVMLRDVVSDALGRDSASRIFSSEN